MGKKRYKFYEKIPCCLLFFLLIAVASPDELSVVVRDGSADDASIMAKLAKSLIPTPPGWSGSNVCKWSGVSCDSSGRVSSISLISKSLGGQLPPDLNQLSNLQSFNIQKNRISGSLPSLSNLPSLQEAHLDSNNFTSVPTNFLSGLTNLQKFSMDENPSLPPWTIPDSLTDSTTLADFSASNANIMGQIPDIFGSFPSLESLRLSYNNLTGFLPYSFAKSGIQNLVLNNQKLGLTGRIDVLGSMEQLTQAWIHVNKFEGPIPDLSLCTNLIDIQLRDNSLTGVVPPSLTSLPKLTNASLQNNIFLGPIPGFKPNVQATLGNTNHFCNPFPGPCDPQVTILLDVAGAVGCPKTLAESWSGNNPCKGWNYITCDAKGTVTVINFAKQNWVGTISPAVANLTGLKSLVMNDNNLTGPIPVSLTSLPELQLVDVSNNNISGKIPKFRPDVILKTSGNSFIGKDVPLSAPPGARPSSSSSTNNNSPSAAKDEHKSSISTWVIVAIVIAVVVLILVLCLVLYKYKRNRKSKLNKGKEQKLKNGSSKNMKGYGAIPSTASQSDTSNSEIYVYDGGHVTIPVELLREATNNFSKENILGRGGFGIVYKGRLHDGTEIAVKRMEASIASNKGLTEFRAEIEVLTKVRHRHLVALHGFCVNGYERLLVYEYMPQGTLGQHLFDHDQLGFLPLTWKQRLTIALDVARGVEYLHGLAQQSFIHRDLKPSNVLLGDDMRAKVSDFGLVKNAPDGKYSVETRLAGTFGYLAPEYASTGRVTTKIDVFAFGVILMEILTGRKALDESLPEDRSHLVVWFKKMVVNKEKIIEVLDPTLDPDEETYQSICKVVELAGHCAAREPSQRPDMGHVVNVLAPLVEQWTPTATAGDDSFNIDFTMSLPQALQKWKANDNSMLSEDTSYGDYSASTRTSQSITVIRKVSETDKNTFSCTKEHQ
ncbi:receptor-like kinase TMK4 [Solanum lycopersicum]|uniref:non-specific serine/threonine protein kinase n=1 Tax=Solanum lycopersicum TaxID=4081 RepID=A0A3Q7I257_SOLLC|nr:receptor-like kinase TMK4 [Solanum lycopersicum]